MAIFDLGIMDMVFGKKVAIFEWEWGQNLAPRDGQKISWISSVYGPLSLFQYFENYHGLPAGESALYLNGIPMDMEVYDVFSLLDIMRSEAKIMEGLFSLGLKVSVHRLL